MAEDVVLKDDNPNNDLVDNLTGFVTVSFGDTSILTIKEEERHSTPQYVQSLEFKRVTNSLGEFTLTLVDNEWTTIEKLINQYNGKIILKYGMIGVNEKVNSSPEITARIYTYDIVMFLDYVEVNIQGLCLGTDMLGSSMVGSTAKAREEATQGVIKSGLDGRSNSSISAYVKEIAEALGFEGKYVDVEDTTTPYAKEDLGSTKDLEKTLHWDNAMMLKLIIGKLAAKATAADEKKGAFVFFISPGTEEDSNPTFHFHRVNREQEREPKRVLTLYSDPTSHIKSFRPSFENSVANIFGGKAVTAFGYNRMDGTMMGISYANTSGTSKKNPQDQPDIDRLASYAAGGFNTNNEAVKALVNQISVAPLTAELVMVGDAKYNLCETIDVYVQIPTGPDKGQPHNTSNRYIIMGITDSIQMGEFVTTLQLGTGFGFTPAGKDVNKIVAGDAKAVAASLSGGKTLASPWVMPTKDTPTSSTNIKWVK